MIYQLKLPELTLKRLTDVVYLQMCFLRYASSRTALDQQSCENYFSRHPRFRGRHQQIAKWLWGKQRLTFLKLLEKFAQGSTEEKRQWSKQMYREVIEFLQNPVGSITPNINKPTLSWQIAATEFLIKFYDEYLGDSKGAFPKSFFSDSELERFGREKFLSEFEKLNRIKVCPACDDERYRRIDHYLTKIFYPHLSCHPYNLVPICNTCNSDNKGEKNLLGSKSGNLRKLENIFLPYRGDGFQTDTYLKISLEQGLRKPIIIGLEVHPGKDLLERVEVYQYIFNIPHRWQKSIQTIDELVYRQIKQNIQSHVDGNPSKRGNLNIFGVRDLLDGILCNLFDNQGLVQWHFPMTWHLVTLINREIEPAVHSSTAINLENYELLKDIADWLIQDTIPHPAHERRDLAQKLCNVVLNRE